MNSALLKRRGSWWLFAAALALGAFFFRLPKLTERPMHTDEAVHAVKLGILLETGEYQYNPHEYHGPVIYYAALPFVLAAGADSLASIKSEAPLRLPIALFGALLVMAVAVASRSIGRMEAAASALIIAVSPAFVFYSRYYIQEVPFTLFCFLGLAAGWKLLETGRTVWAIGMGLSLGVAIALKETWIMIVGTAGLTTGLLHMTSTNHPWPLPFPWRRFARLFVVAIAISLFTGLALLSNLFQNPAAIADTFKALTGYVLRGVSGDSSTFGAEIHDHPWNYYIKLLAWPDVEGPWIWTEAGTLLLGLVGIVAVIRIWPVARGSWHFIVIFTILLTAFYSAIPYKTPWNVLPLLLGWCLLAGRGAAAIIRAGRSRAIQTAIAAVLLAWPAWLAQQSYKANIARPTDERNPYAYSPTALNVVKLANRAEQISKVAAEGYRMPIQIISPANDYWPLPWYLRHFSRIGYFTDLASAHPDAAMIITTADVDEATLEQLGPRQLEYNGLRPDVMLTTLIRQDLWDEHMAKQTQK